MTLVAKVNLSNVIVERLEITLIPGQYNTRETAAINGKPFLLPIERINFEPFDPETQKRSGPVDTVLIDKVIETYIVTNKTAGELDTEKTEKANRDLDILITKALAAEILVRDKEIVQKVNEVISEASLSATPITELTAAQWKTRLRDRYKSLL